MIAKTEQDFAGLKKIGKIVAEIRDTMKEATVPGMTTKELTKSVDAFSKKKVLFLLRSLNMISLDTLASASIMKLRMAFQDHVLLKMEIL